MYDSIEDAVDKASYYMTHEEERCHIAKAGRRAVEQFSFENQVKKILSEVFEG